MGHQVAYDLWQIEQYKEEFDITPVAASHRGDIMAESEFIIKHQTRVDQGLRLCQGKAGQSGSP